MKSLGQNFLTDKEVLAQITTAADADGILEIGPGIGTLTSALASRAKKVVAVEIDSRLIPVLGETLAGFDNIKIINDDILKLNIKEMLDEEFNGLEVSVAANLPYYITTPIVMGLLEQRLPFKNIVVMVQKEVAQRIVAPPGGKDYGALSIAAQYYAHPKVIAEVGAENFIPRPKVDSTVICLSLLGPPRVIVEDEKFFFSVVKAAFAQRRKTLSNALCNSGIIGLSKEQLKQVFLEVNIDENIRGERLSIEQFAELAKSLKKHLSNIK